MEIKMIGPNYFSDLVTIHEICIEYNLIKIRKYLQGKFLHLYVLPLTIAVYQDRVASVDIKWLANMESYLKNPHVMSDLTLSLR